MHKFLQNKLWRDKAPDLLRKMGSIIHIAELSDTEYDHQLRVKLLEEASEVYAAQTDTELLEELADIFEVIDALCVLRKISLKNIGVIQTKKRDTRGGFYERAFVTIAEHPAGSYGEEYYRANPEKYPEIL